MAYAIYDFSETLERVSSFSKNDVAECLAAWGEQGDHSEWNGGFILRLKDGRIAVVQGWCDTTGWGCQDGVIEQFADADPVDLNRFLRGEIEVS